MDRQPGLINQIDPSAIFILFFQSAKLWIFFAELSQTCFLSCVISVDAGRILGFIEQDDGFLFVLCQPHFYLPSFRLRD